jgi:hypothetical protein
MRQVAIYENINIEGLEEVQKNILNIIRGE